MIKLYTTEGGQAVKQLHPLAALRDARGITQQELADMASVSRATVSCIERGWRLEHPAGSLRAIAKALDVGVPAIIAPDQIAEHGLFESTATWFGLDPENPASRDYLEHLRGAAA